MPEPIVLISAAMAVPSGFYRPLVESFAERGWQAQALPTRGFEREEPTASRSHDWSYDDEISAIANAVAKARADDPERPVILLGHSLGSQLGAGHEIHRTPSDGFVTVGASVPDYRFYPHGGVHLLVLGTSVPVLTRIYGYLPKPFFGGPGARTLMREWARFVRTGRPPFTVPNKITTPSLVIQLQGDLYAVSKANKQFVELFIDPKALTRWVYSKTMAPEGGAVDHLMWVKTPDVVVDQIISWWASAPSRV
ncbi:MAG: alpha/beta fold hydrolase [Aeromicrobium sp.]